MNPRASQRRPPAGPHVAPTLHDPGVEVGPYRILPRADGVWIAYDERQPIGRRTAFTGTSEGEVTARAKAAVGTVQP